MINVSASALGILEDCPRCFWFDRIEKRPRPRGIFPSLPGGFDKIIKTYMDGFRKQLKLPPELSDQNSFEKGYILFEDQAKMDRMRNWRTGLKVAHSVDCALIGALDDLLYIPEQGLYMPLDYKTKGSPTSAEDALKYYQRQLDCYDLLLSKNGYPTTHEGILLYYSPGSMYEIGNCHMHTQIITISTDPARAESLLEDASDILSLEKPPAPAIDCEYCEFIHDRIAFSAVETFQKQAEKATGE